MELAYLSDNSSKTNIGLATCHVMLFRCMVVGYQLLKELFNRSIQYAAFVRIIIEYEDIIADVAILIEEVPKKIQWDIITKYL
jgi:hypothetical protein